MKLNIGAGWPGGRYRAKEWINLDLVRNQRMTVQGDALFLPFKTDTLEEVHCCHMLEHLTREKYPKVLQEINRVLQPGKKAYIEVPDFHGTIEILHSVFNMGDPGLIHNWTTSLFGKSENPGMAHHWAFYDKLLIQAMEDAGFKEVYRSNKLEDMISTHYRHDIILLVIGTK